MMRRYWISKAAREHVDIVKQKKYTQINMGPKGALERMNIGDWIIYYSPTIYFEQDEPICQKFTGISCVIDNRVYPQSNQFPDRWRRNVEFFDCIPYHPQHFIDQVDFIPKSENWMDIFLQPIFEIQRKDFVTIADTIIISKKNRILLY
ncbi:MAG TPA: EVE domain-containing protein [Candidatus Saccharimonadales bacterium]|nr:EVE domain-containing protein [Candidatus Saccharimonadales bacterium]